MYFIQQSHARRSERPEEPTNPSGCVCASGRYAGAFFPTTLPIQIGR